MGPWYYLKIISYFLNPITLPIPLNNCFLLSPLIQLPTFPPHLYSQLMTWQKLIKDLPTRYHCYIYPPTYICACRVYLHPIVLDKLPVFLTEVHPYIFVLDPVPFPHLLKDHSSNALLSALSIFPSQLIIPISIQAHCYISQHRTTENHCHLCSPL